MGSNYLSPLVDIKELDLSATIPAVATSVAVIALRETYKGQEFKKILISDEDTLIETFGEPTTDSYKDIMAAIGYLKYGNKLYCTRCMSPSATFAGTLATSGYSTSASSFQSFTDYGMDAIDYGNLENGDPDEFPENNISFDNEQPFGLIASSRGAWGNNIRVAVIDKSLYDEISGKTITSALSATAAAWETAYNDADVDTKNTMSYYTIYETDSSLDSNKDFLIIVQVKEQGSDEYTTTEILNVSTDETKVDDDGVSRFAETYVNENSDYIRLAMNATYTNTDITIGNKYFEYLEDGDDDSDGFTNEEDTVVINAYNLYSNPEEIDVNLFIDADKSVTVKQELISICEDTRKDSFAILDVPRSYVINASNEAENLRQWRTGLDGSGFNPNTSYAALYGNWIEVYDTYNSKYRWIPFSGHAAGLYANTDNVAEPWFAPAGLNRTILTSVRRLAWNPTLGERDILFSNGINPVISMASKGKVVWGEKTLLDKESSFNAINVRRLFLVLEKAISTSLAYFLFEQNDEVTRLQIRNMISPFLRDVKAKRGIYSYACICDSSNNTDERIDRAELWVDVYIKPTRAARYIILRMINTKTGASFDEIASSLT